MPFFNLDNEDFIGPAKVLTPDVLVFNGVVQIIDTVLDFNSTILEVWDWIIYIFMINKDKI